MKTFFTLLFSVFSLYFLQAQTTIIGKTSYDVQTNNASKNRIKIYDDGSISTLWTGSTDYAVGTTWNDRGMFYNHYDGGSWGALPTARIEAVKTGFGEILTVEDHEVVIGHDGINMRLYANEAPGSTTWTELDGSGASTIVGFWPMTDCPAGTDDIYVVNANANPPTALYFSRSDDGGESWAILNSTIPYLTSTEGIPGLNTGLTTAAETYQIKVYGSDVYVLFGMPNSDLVLLHSDDYGNDGSWESQVIVDFPFDSYTGTVQTDVDGDGVTDTIPTNDGYHDMIMEDDGTLHVFSGYTQVYSDAGAFSYTYNYDGWGFWHWTTGMAEAELINTELDWVNDECDNDPMAGIGAYRFTYRYSSNATSPGAAWDPVTGRLYLLYTMFMEYTDLYDDPTNLSAQSRRDIFGMYSDDGGSTWSQPANLTFTADDEQENFFLFVNDRVYDGKVHAIWQQDDEPGSTPGEFDAVDTSYILYAAWDPEAFVVSLPDADFDYTSDLSLFNFTDASSDNFPCYSWDFGDGETSDFVNPSHIYALGGTYTVCLTVSNTYGSDTYCQDVTVPGAPVAAFSWSGDAAVTFTDLTENDPTSWSWDFDDGGSSTDQNPVHTYTFDGTYNVCLTASNALGSSEYCALVTIVNAIGAPVADFTYTISGFNIELTDISTESPDSWSWNFGDGESSTEQNPSHTYAAGASYNVCLTVTNAVGGDTECKNVSISTGIETIANDGITVYPNPSDGYFIIDSELEFQSNEIVITNSLGQPVLYDLVRTDNHNWEVRLQQPANGNYLVRISTSQGIVYRNLTIQK